MSINFMHEVLVIVDRFVDTNDSLDKLGHLPQVLVVVIIFHAIMGISFIKMEEYEHRHPRIIRDTNVSFEIAPPPPLLSDLLIPRPISLIQDQANPGNEAQDTSKRQEKMAIANNKAAETRIDPRTEPVKTQYAHELAIAPPVSVTTNNQAKAEPVAAKRTTSPEAQRDNQQRTGPHSSSTPSGAGYDAGSSDDGRSSGKTRGGKGSDGQGHESGDEGTGTEKGNPGSEKITTRVRQSERAMFNIAPYRKQILLQIAANWHPKTKTDVTVLFVVGRDGKVLKTEILESSGDRRLDAQAAAAIESIEFDPIPEVLKDESLTFKVDLAALKNTPM